MFPETFSPSLLHARESRTAPLALRYTGAESVEEWQTALRTRLSQALGLHRMPSAPPPLAPRSIWKKEFADGTVEKLHFTVEEGCDAPVYLCLPRTPRSTPIPLFICLTGHGSGMHNSIARSLSNEDEVIPIEGDREFALTCMRHGIAALCLEQRGFGERKEFRIGNSAPTTTCVDASGQALLLGRTLIGERVYDVRRSVELLRELAAERPDLPLDFERIGCLGNSGGGTTTLYAAALLPEIRYAIPSAAFCLHADSIQAMSHCICNYVPGLLEFAEAGDIAGLIAPKPLVIVNGREDNIFPIEGAISEFARVREIYQAAGAGERLHHVIGEGGHRFYAEGAWNAMLAHLDQKPC